MTFNTHLTKILAQHQIPLKDKNFINQARQDIVEYLQQEFGDLMSPLNSGSIAKGTAIQGSDLDVAICFKPNSYPSVKEIYGKVHQALKRRYKGKQQIIKCRVAIKVQLDSVEVDVLPCLDLDGTYICLYNIMKRKKQRASIKIHIDNAQRVRQFIKLMKIWRKQHHEFREGKHKLSGFALELLVIRALRNRSPLDLAQGFKRILLYIKSCILNVKLNDPSNSNNELDIHRCVRYKIKTEADSAYKNYKRQIWVQIIS